MYNNIPENYCIYKKAEKKYTINRYKKTDVFKDLEKNMLSENIEKSILWTSEILASNYLEELYEKLLEFYINHINKLNINLIEIFYLEFINFYKFKASEQEFMNNQYIRNHVTNLVCLLTFSTKCSLPKLPKIDTKYFNMKNNKLLTNDLSNIQKFIDNDDDDKNIIIPLSEIYLNLNIKNVTKSLENCLFWLNWILIYEKNFHKNNLECHYTKINDKTVLEKFRNDFTWIIWKMILTVDTNIYLQNLYKLYCLHFNKTRKRKRINLIILAFIIIINPLPKINFEEAIITKDNNIIKNKIIACINLQYQDLLKNKENDIKYDKLKHISPFFSKEKFTKNYDLNNIYK